MKLSLREKTAYGLGDTACNLVFATALSFLLFYYTDIFGLSAAAAAALLMGVRVLDALIDLSVGLLSDRTETRWGKFRPWLLWFSAPMAVSMVLTFTVPSGSANFKLFYAWATYLLLMSTFSAINLPYSALSAVMTDDPHERTSLAGIRMVGAETGALIVSGCTLPLVALLGAATGNVAAGYQRTMVLFGLAALAMLLVTFLGTKERIRPLAGQDADVRGDLSMLLHNRPWIILTCGAALLSTFWAVRQAVVIYYFKYCLNNEPAATTFLTLTCVASIFGALLSLPISRRLGKRLAFRLGALATGVFWSAGYWTAPDSIFWLEALNVLSAVSMFTVMPLLFSMLGDTADYGEYRRRRRATGIIFSASTFATKVGMGVGSAATGTVLALWGYTPGAQLSASTLNAISFTMSIVPGAGFLLLALFMGLYSLDENQSQMIRRELTARRSNGRSTAPAAH